MTAKNPPEGDNSEQKVTESTTNPTPWGTVEVDRKDGREYETRVSPPPPVDDSGQR